jgi:sigma-B regulation protein RsbU (phosphoserine phosphatase)
LNSILIVDDQSDNRSLLRIFLKKEGLDVLEAENGSEALELLHEMRPDLVLLDIMMPGIDGYEVCRRIKTDPDTQDITIIFLSAENEVAAKVKGFELGAADYITKPFEKAEVIARVKTHLKVHSLTKSLISANLELQQNQALLENDLKAAAEIQLSLLPLKLPQFETCTLVSRFLPSDYSSGDIYNVHQLDHDTIALYIADVSGHGVPAAMVTVSIAQTLLPHGQSLLKKILADPPYYQLTPPLEVVQKLDEIYPLNRFDKFFTIVYALVNLRTGQMRYCNAGHPYPAITRQGDTTKELEHGGPIIGMGDMVPFEEGSLQLSPGDRLFLYTDGITELENRENEQFGFSRLRSSLEQSSDKTLGDACDALFDEASLFAQARPAEDDITLLALEFTDYKQ